MNAQPNGTTSTLHEWHTAVAPAHDDVLPWLTDPKIALAFCPAHAITIRNWMLVGMPGLKSWSCELEVAIGSRTFLAEIEVELIDDGRYQASVSAASDPLLICVAATLQGAMLLAEQMAAIALCEICNAFAGGDPPT